MTRERISFTSDPIDMLLSLQMGFSFVRAAVAYSIFERISGLEPSSQTTAPRYLKLVTVPSFGPLPYLSLDAIGDVCNQFGLLESPASIFGKFCLNFLPGLLAPALPQLEYICHRQAADWESFCRLC